MGLPSLHDDHEIRLMLGHGLCEGHSSMARVGQWDMCCRCYNMLCKWLLPFTIRAVLGRDSNKYTLAEPNGTSALNGKWEGCLHSWL